MKKTLLLLLAISAAMFGADEYGKRGTTYAQKLLDETMAKHPDVIIMAFHVAAPGSHDYNIIASNIGRIGKKADEDDMRVINTGKTNLEVNEKGDHFEAEVALRDKSGKIIGACGIVWNYKAGDDKAAHARQGEVIAKELQAKIPTLAKLFEPLQ